MKDMQDKLSTGPMTSGRIVFGTPLTVALLVMIFTRLPLLEAWIAGSIRAPSYPYPAKVRAKDRGRVVFK